MLSFTYYKQIHWNFTSHSTNHFHLKFNVSPRDILSGMPFSQNEIFQKLIFLQLKQANESHVTCAQGSSKQWQMN